MMPEALLEPLVEPMLPVEVRVINLNTSTQRWHNMTRQMDALGMTYRRFPAVEGWGVFVRDTTTGNGLRGEDLINHPRFFVSKRHYTVVCYPNSLDKSTVSFTYVATAYPHPTAGELGATCSHRALWHQAVINGWERTLIMEDDLTFTPNFWLNTQLAHGNMTHSYDALYHFVLTQEGSQSPHDLGAVERYSAELIGAQAYTITPRGAMRLLQVTDTMYTEALDLEITRKRFRLIVYKTKRHDLSSLMDSNFSDIHKRGRAH